MLQFLLIVIQILIPGKRFYYVHNMKLLVLTRLVQKGFEIWLLLFQQIQKVLIKLVKYLNMQKKVTF